MTLEDFFDDDIPDEVLNSDGWAPRLLPDLNNLNSLDYDYDDIQEDYDNEY